MDMANNILKMVIHMMAIMLIINLKVKAFIVGKVELIIMDNLNMENEMGMEYGNPVAKNMILIKVTILMIKSMEKVYTDGLMGLFTMAGLRKT